MPSCSGINIDAAGGRADAGLDAATGSVRGLGAAAPAGLFSAGGAGFAAAAGAGVRGAVGTGAFSGDGGATFFAAGRADLAAAVRDFAAGALAGATREAAGPRGARDPAFAALRLAAGEGFDATFFTSTSTDRNL
jgi:hypothetical protein